MAPQLPKFVDEQHTPTEWLAVANTLAQRVLRLDARSAWEQVRAGHYAGTPFAAELSQLMFLAGDEPIAHAAE